MPALIIFWQRLNTMDVNPELHYPSTVPFYSHDKLSNCIERR